MLLSRHSSLSLLLLAGCLVGTAHAAPIGIPGQGSSLPAPLSFDGSHDSGGGYTPRVNPTRGVVPFDRSSLSLTMFDQNFNSMTVNSLGDWNCIRGSSLIDGGANRNGTGRILFSWDETVSGTRTFIRATIRSSNAEALFPTSSVITFPGGGTSPAAFWSWQFGITDPVDFQSNITQVTLLRSSVSLSRNGGQSYSSTMTTTPSIPHAADWRPGFDPGQLMTAFGDGTNFILLQYEVAYVPPPGSVVLVAAGLAAIGGRRRR
jgi:hypothetical protein